MLQSTLQETQSLTSTRATPRHYRLAGTVVGILILVSLLALPYARRVVLPLPLFLPIYTPLALFTDLITAYLLFGQFLSTRKPPLAVLAATYLYASLVTLPYILTFPGVFSATGLLHASSQTAGWLWVFWHIGFPLGICLYLTADKHYSKVRLSARQSYILFAFLLVLIPCLLVLSSVAAIYWYSLLPTILRQGDYNLMITTGVGPTVLVISAAACVYAFLRIRGRSVVHIWLAMAAFASVLDVILSLSAGSRYSVGWYISRADSVIAAAVVLCALLYEVNRLYARLALQNEILEQQSSRLTEQNELLEQQSKMQSDFISVVGHEFRTALTGILGFSEMMREEDFSPQEVKEFASDISVDAKRLTRLITEMLDLDRMKSGRMELNPGHVEINALITGIANRAHGVTLQNQVEMDLDPAQPLLWGDPDKLTQIVTNLLNNAIKYSPEGGKILLRSRQEGDVVHLTVQDHGMGIPTEKLEQVFERYARIQSVSTRYIAGTGLGLPIVRQIVEMHQGKVWVESTPGKGSIFHVTLPLTKKGKHMERKLIIAA